MTRCVECGKAVDRRANQTYQYTECGLKNVWLVGITVYRCRGCGDTFPEIPNLDFVHRKIADAITEKKFALMGPEFRFLRKQMRMKAKDLAAFLGVTPTTISRWETGAEKIGTTNDRLMRSYYMFWRLQQGEVAEPTRVLEHVRNQFEGLKARPKSEKISLLSEVLEAAGL